MTLDDVKTTVLRAASENAGRTIHETDALENIESSLDLIQILLDVANSFDIELLGDELFGCKDFQELSAAIFNEQLLFHGKNISA